MQTENRFLDDLAKLMLNAAGAAQGMKAEMENVMRQRLERWFADMNLVPRDEFDAVRAMAAAAREENSRLSARLAALEAQLAAQKKPGKSRASKPRKLGGAAPKRRARITPR
jgi:BMFP domain-containing protein YqiC